MRLRLKDLDQLLECSLDAFLAAESNALLSGVSERNSCGRLAIHVQRELQERGLTKYYADVEYNRKQNGELKTLVDDQLRVISITCDLIVHSRGQSVLNDNLIAVEMKKSDRPQTEKDSDRERLKIMTRRSFDGIWSNDGVTHPEHVCGYRVGAFIEVNRADRALTIDYFKGGAYTKTRVKRFLTVMKRAYRSSLRPNQRLQRTR
jgi:hypothetical protein